MQPRIYDISENIDIQVVEQIKKPLHDGFAFNWMNPRMWHHVLNFLFSFDTSITLILRMIFYSLNIWIHKHVELTYIAN